MRGGALRLMITFGHYTPSYVIVSSFIHRMLCVLCGGGMGGMSCLVLGRDHAVSVWWYFDVGGHGVSRSGYVVWIRRHVHGCDDYLSTRLVDDCSLRSPAVDWGERGGDGEACLHMIVCSDGVWALVGLVVLCGQTSWCILWWSLVEYVWSWGVGRCLSRCARSLFSWHPAMDISRIFFKDFRRSI